MQLPVTASCECGGIVCSKSLSNIRTWEGIEIESWTKQKYKAQLTGLFFVHHQSGKVVLREHAMRRLAWPLRKDPPRCSSHRLLNYQVSTGYEPYSMRWVVGSSLREPSASPATVGQLHLHKIGEHGFTETPLHILCTHC